MNETLNPGPMSRRQLLAQALACAGCWGKPSLATAAASMPWVHNVSRLYPVEVARIVAPRGTGEVAAELGRWPGQVAVGGGRYSMGGQVAVRAGLHLDMREMKRLLWLDPASRTARVQAGMRWRDLQDHLDPVGLAVKTMQSYANFTVGGSVSVNAHGRYVGHGALGRTVRALQLVLADGAVVEASPTLRAELFRAAIGGYGGVGVITEVELDLAQNLRIERHAARVALDDYVGFVRSQVLGDAGAVLHNADLLPPRFDRPVAVTWRRADPQARLTQVQGLVPRGQAYTLERDAIWAMTELPGGERFWAAVVHPRLQGEPSVKWLNHEASLDVAALEPLSRAWSTYALQEYFVPPAAVPSFARAMAAILRRHGVEALNVSLRHAPADEVSVLPWAATEVFCFVLYFKQGTSARAQAAVGRWTRELIDAALGHGGRFYLPYQLHATREQFEAAYPAADHFRRIKQAVDPAGRLSNEMWRRYL